MKVIDLLNKIAKGENLPNKVKLECVNSINEHNCFYEFNPIAETYVNGDNQLIQNATCFATLLNLEVEIIEEDKKIEKITLDDWVEFTTIGDMDNIDFMFNKNSRTFVDKINEIIDKLNKENK